MTFCSLVCVCRGLRTGQHHAELVHPLHSHRGYEHRGHHGHVQQHHRPAAPGLPSAGEPGEQRADASSAVCHEGPSELCAVGPHALREGPHRLRDGLPDCAGRGHNGDELHAAVHHRALHGAPRLPHACVQTGHARDGAFEPELQPGHTSRHQRRALGLCAQPLTGKKRACRHHPSGGEERQVRHRAFGHIATLHVDHAWHGGAAQPQELWEVDVIGQSPAKTAFGRYDRGLHQHNALAAHAHQPTALQRVHRVPQQSQRDFSHGARRTHSVHTVHRQPETDIQRQKETHDART